LVVLVLTLLVGWQEGHPACKNWLVTYTGVIICLGEVQMICK